jgi:hypothetical protein
MTFAHVFDPPGIGPSPQCMRDPNALLWGELDVLLRIPTVGCAKTAALFDNSFHPKQSNGIERN